MYPLGCGCVRSSCSVASGKCPSLHVIGLLIILSSSVPLGNEGQLAYVGANAFMDALAEYRRACGLPGLSLQLGAWESDMVKDLDFTGAPVQNMTHQEGVEAVLEAIESQGDAVSVIAKLDTASLATTSAGRDVMFRHIIAKSAQQKSSAVVEREFLRILAQFLDLPETKIGEQRPRSFVAAMMNAFAQICLTRWGHVDWILSHSPRYAARSSSCSASRCVHKVHIKFSNLKWWTAVRFRSTSSRTSTQCKIS